MEDLTKSWTLSDPLPPTWKHNDDLLERIDDAENYFKSFSLEKFKTFYPDYEPSAEEKKNGSVEIEMVMGS